MYGRAGLSIGSANRPSHQPLPWAIVRSHKFVRVVYIIARTLSSLRHLRLPKVVYIMIHNIAHEGATNGSNGSTVEIL